MELKPEEISEIIEWAKTYPYNPSALATNKYGLSIQEFDEIILENQLDTWPNEGGFFDS